MKPQPFHCFGSPRLVGDPVDVVSGANTDVTLDFRLQGPLPLRWRRYYSSARNTVACSLGWGHTHDFDRTLTYDLDGLHYTDPLGSTVAFPSLQVGQSEDHAGFALHRVTATVYELRQASQPIHDFDFQDFGGTARLRRVWQGQFEVSFQYDDNGNLRQIVDSLGRSIAVESHPDGRLLGLFARNVSERKKRALMVYEYDDAGNVVVARDPYDATLRFEWDEHNRMISRTDRRGYSFHFKYDEEGRCVLSVGEDGLLEVQLEYQPDLNTTVVRRGDGGQWIYAYDAKQTIIQITDPYGNATRFTKDDLGRPAQEIDPNGNVTTLHYNWRGEHDFRIDPNGYVLPTKDADPSPVDPLAYKLPTTALEWDFGRLVNVSGIQPPDKSDRLIAQFPPAVIDSILGNVHQAGVTDRGPSAANTDDELQPVARSGATLTQLRKYDANGNLVEHQDRDGSVYRSVYRSWNALAESIDPLGNATSFELTVQGLMAKVTDPGGTVTEYGYDLREKLVEVREVGRVVERYQRDAAGNVVQKTDASGKTLVTWEVGPGNLDKVRFLGSGERQAFEHDARGRIIKSEGPTGIATFVYDDDNHLLVDQRDGKGVVHEFDFTGLVTTTYFDKFKVTYETLSKSEKVVQDPTGGRHRFQFGETGLVAKFLANGSRELSAFNADGRWLGKAVARSAQDPTPWTRKYKYSAAGDLLAVVDSAKGTTTYRHDAAHRLAEEVSPSHNASRRFELDRAGNLIRQPGLANVVVGEGNRLQEANGETFTYNHRLNLSERQGPAGSTRYEYDDLDMLVRCYVEGEVWTAGYDGLGRRVKKTWRAQTTTYYWDDFRLAAELRHDGSCRLYIYVDESALAPFLFVEYERLTAAPGSGKRFYVFTNQVSAPIRVENENGQPVWFAQIDPYGTSHIDISSTVDMPLRFPGHYFDCETGLHYNRFRYFSPELGRYLQSDPAGLAGGINAYAYLSKPLTFVDIDGLGPGGAKPPKVKGAPAPSVGCHAEVSKNLTPDQAKKELEDKAKKLMADIKKQQAENDKLIAAGKPPITHVTAPDGTLLQIHKSVGPCVSLAYDSKTGKVYYGQNTEKRPDPMHPTLEDNADKAADWNHDKGKDKPYQKEVSDGEGGKKEITVQPPYGMYPMKGVPGDHSEVNAVNNGMIDREKDPKADPPQTKDYTVYNTNSDPESNKAGQGKPCCPNCKKVLGGPNDGPNDKGDWVTDKDNPGATDVSR